MRLAVVAVSSFFALIAFYLLFWRKESIEIEAEDPSDISDSDSEEENEEQEQRSKLPPETKVCILKKISFIIQSMINFHNFANPMCTDIADITGQISHAKQPAQFLVGIA